MNATDLLDRHYLEVRAKLLEIAATLDRLDRAEAEASAKDPRLQQLMEGLEILQNEQNSRAEQVQLLFSRKYDPDWRETLKV